MSRLPLSTKCNDPLSARSVEATAVVASVGDGHEEFFPGYYNAKGVYIYYQSDNGNDYFGYYDDDGVYSYCEGDITKVMFSPILAEVETKTDAGKATDSLLYVIDADNRDKVYVKHNLLEEDEENFIEDVNKFSHRFELKRSDQDVSVNDALRRDTDAKITLKREKSVTFLQEDKAKTKSMGKKGSKKDMVNLDDLDVDAVVNHADDLSGKVACSQR